MTETGKHVLTQNPYNLIWNSINPYEFTGKFSLHVLDLSYISKVTDDVKNTSLYHWACLFKATTWKKMLAMAEQSESIKKAVVTLRQLTNDEKIKLQCEARERYRMDWQSSMRTSFEKGKKRGWKKLPLIRKILFF